MSKRTGENTMNHEELLPRLAMEMAEWPSAGWLEWYCPWPGQEYARFFGEKLLTGRVEKGTRKVVATRQEWLAKRKELINEPDDADLSVWARYKAQDANGNWWAYECPPDRLRDIWNQVQGQQAFICYGNLPAGHDWRETLKEVKRETETEPAWNGDGLPPVGSRCMMKSPILGMWAGKWIEVEVVAHVDAVAVGWCHAKNISVWAGQEECCPLRTTEQEAVDKIHAVIMALPDGTNTKVAAQDIYNAIRDGKVPGVGLTR